GPSLVSLVAADFSGKLDLAVATFGSNEVSILLGNGDGTFQPPKVFVMGVDPEGVSLGNPVLVAWDFNGDGRIDLAKSDPGNLGYGFDPGGVSVLLGNGDGTFQTPEQNITGMGSTYVVAGDFNGDGKIDLATTVFGGLSSGPTSVSATDSLSI